MSGQGIKRLLDANYSLIMLAVVGVTIAIYLQILLQYGETAHLGMSALFMLACGTLLWERRSLVHLERKRLGTWFGLMGVMLVWLVGSFLLKAGFEHTAADPALLRRPGLNAAVRLLPAFGSLAIALLAAGCSGLRQFWREIAIVLALGLPGTVAAFMADISPLTARFSTALLWYGGFDAVREGVYILLEVRGVEVYYGCSGIESVSYLLGLSALCLIMFPLSGGKRYCIPFIGMLIGFFVNAVRVALMTILVASGRNAAFEYWHTGDGSLIFGLIAVVAFGCFYLLMQTWDYREKQAANQPVAETEGDSSKISQEFLAFLEREDS